jgi:hypothetical protein
MSEELHFKPYWNITYTVTYSGRLCIQAQDEEQAEELARENVARLLLSADEIVVEVNAEWTNE